MRRWVRFPARWRMPRPRAGVELGTALIVTALVAGLVFGNGVSRTVVDTVDGLTWLGDNARGQVVQVNPSTGQVENQLQIAQPNSDLEVRQRDGMLVVLDRRTGVVNVIDLATLLTSGRRQVSPGGAAEVLLDGDRIYVVDQEKATITNVDPTSAQTVGQPWHAERPLADAAVDGASSVWAIDRSGQLHALTWSDDASRFVEEQSRPVDGAGDDAILVAHERGVTVLGPGSGVVVQVGTEDDRALVVPSLRDPVHAAELSPPDLVPAAVESTGTVILVRDDEVLKVTVGDIGCDRPGQPAVFEGHVYVPCLGARKVIVLDRNGHRPESRPDIRTPEGGDPELVLDDGRLVVNVPGADTGVVVEPDGSTRTISTGDDDLPARDPAPPPPSPTPPPPAPNPSDAAPPPAEADGPGLDLDLPGPLPDIDIGTEPEPSSPPPVDLTVPEPTPTPSAPGTPDPPPDPPSYEDVQPHDMTAQARADGSVLVSWQPGAARPAHYRLFFVPNRGWGDPDRDPTAPVVAVPGAARSASVTTVAVGVTGRFVVEGQPDPEAPATNDETLRRLLQTQQTNEVTLFTWPSPPPQLGIDFELKDPRTFDAVIVWTSSETNGRPVTSYRLEAWTSDGQRFSTEIDANRVESPFWAATARFTCTAPAMCDGLRVTAEVVAVNEAGPGQPATAESTFDHPATFRSGSVLPGPLPLVIALVGAGIALVSWRRTRSEDPR